MTYDSTPHRVLKINELTRLIANQLVLISRKSAVNLACVCRSLEEPNLSALWEAQSSLFTLLGVLSEGTWELRCLKFGGDMVCVLDPPSDSRIESLSLGHFSSRLWGIHRRRIGTEFGATRLGCTKSAWKTRRSSKRKPPTNYASIHLLVDGSQRCKIYFGPSLNPISLTPTCSSLHI